MEYDPKHISALINMGVALFGLKNYTGSLTYLDRALRINRTMADAIDDKGLPSYSMPITLLFYGSFFKTIS
jgi:hypothetical protein